jgi:hypothetical protein
MLAKIKSAGPYEYPPGTINESAENKKIARPLKNADKVIKLTDFKNVITHSYTKP